MPASAAEKNVPWPERIPAHYSPQPEPSEVSEETKALQAMAERMDHHDLLFTGKVVIDKSREMLLPPERVAHFEGNKFSVAKTAPRIEFGVIPHTPRFFPEPVDQHHRAMWANWGQAAYYEPTDTFYCSIGDNGSYNAHLYIVGYDPAAMKFIMSPEINEVLGRPDNVFSEGKIHGNLDFVDGPNLWFCTYWSKYPEIFPEDWASGYIGGHIMTYNVLTHEFVDYGVPMPGASWPASRVDPKRKMLYAAGYDMEFLAWDMDLRKPVYAGLPPTNTVWSNRVMMIDDVTGRLYTSNRHADDPNHSLIRYDPATNKHTLLESAPMPADEIGEKHEIQDMRASTEKRGPDGLLHGITANGQLFSFDPESETTKDLGYGWPGEERYTTSLQRSPTGKYIYYCPGAHGEGFRDGSPIMQYNVETGERKVLAFVDQFYRGKYGYTPSGTFSIKLDPKGKRLFICWNGGFYDEEVVMGKSSGSFFQHNAAMLVHIPESERRE